MDFAPTGSLGTGSILWRTRRGAFAMTVVCKATFTLAPGRSLPAPTQEPVHELDAYVGQDPARWVWAPADLVPYKVRADVLLVGHAYAPDGKPARYLRARLAISGIDKAVEVWCDRRRNVDGRVLEGAPQAKLALGWDRAAQAPQNPAGISTRRLHDAYGTAPLPAVVWPEGDPRARSEAAAGFGPIAPFWPGRVEKLGAHRMAALPPTWQGAALPEDADDAAFQAAAPDQQLNRLDAEPRVLLENLHPSHPRLETTLSRVSPQAVVERPGRAPEPLGLVADTLWIDTDRGICTVTWRAWLMLSHAAEAGVVRLRADGIEVAPRPPASAPEKVPTRAPTAGFDPRGTSAVDPAVLFGARATPFEGPGRPSNSMVGSPPVFGPPPPVAPAPSMSPPVPPSAAPAPPLVAAPVAVAGSAPGRGSGAWDPRGTSALDPALLTPRPSVPFVPAVEGAPPPSFPERSSAAPRFDPRETRAVDATFTAATLAALPFPTAHQGPPPPPPPVDATSTLPLATPVATSTLPLATPVASLEAPPVEPPAPSFPVLTPAPLGAETVDDRTPPAGIVEVAPFDVQPPEWVGPPKGATEAAPLAVPPLLSIPGIETPPAAGSFAVTQDVKEDALPSAPKGKREEIEDRLRKGESLDGCDFSNLRVAGIRLDGASLVGASFERSDLTGASLQRAVLTGARLALAVLERADLRGATLRTADLTGADLRGADLTKAILEKAMLQGARCAEARFDAVDAVGARLNDADVTGGSFRGARLESAHLRGARCVKAIFVDASLKRSVADRANLTEADLTRADLEKASLRDATLRAATLADVKLDGSDLRGADLSNAKAPRASMMHARTDGMKKDGAEGL